MGCIRFLLALAVVITHAGFLFNSSYSTMTGGAESVRLFFIISGFYMAMVLSEKYTGKGVYLLFIKNRLLRLFPIHLCILFTTVAIGFAKFAYSGRHLEPFVEWAKNLSILSPLTAVLLVLPNFILVGSDLLLSLGIDPTSGNFVLASTPLAIPATLFLITPPIWSLGVELFFYMLAPFLVRRKTYSLIALFFAALFLRELWFQADPLNSVLAGKTFLRFFPLFFLGIFSYSLYSVLRKRGALHKQLCLFLYVLTLGAIVLYGFLPTFPSLLGIDLFEMLFTLSIPWIFHVTKSWRLERKIGELSYPIYLCHFLVVTLVQGVPIALIQTNKTLVICIVTVVYAFVLERYVAGPFERWRHSRLNPQKNQAKANGCTDSHSLVGMNLDATPIV